MINKFFLRRKRRNRELVRSSFNTFIVIWEGTLSVKERNKLIDAFMDIYDSTVLCKR